jgi:hypothetical protein
LFFYDDNDNDENKDNYDDVIDDNDDNDNSHDDNYYDGYNNNNGDGDGNNTDDDNVYLITFASTLYPYSQMSFPLQLMYRILRPDILWNNKPAYIHV